MDTSDPQWTLTDRAVNLSGTLKFVMFVGELSGRYEAVLVLVLFFKDILHHVLMEGVVGRVTVTLKLLPQIFFHLVD